MNSKARPTTAIRLFKRNVVPTSLNQKTIDDSEQNEKTVKPIQKSHTNLGRPSQNLMEPLSGIIKTRNQVSTNNIA